MSDILEFAKEIVLRGGKILRDALCQDIACNYKDDDQRELLTEYDVKIENFFIQNITRHYPQHNIISEEKENNDKLDGYVWIIDPIDGTTNFVSWQKSFAISLALYEGEKPIFGLVYDVVQDDLYMGISGQGAYLNDRKLKKLEQVKLEKCLLDASLNSVQIFYNKYNLEIFNLAKDIRGHRCCGAASLAICKIALGELQIYISAKLKIWDFAAAGIILNEVGGYYNSLYENNFNFTGKPMPFIACSSKEIYNEILAKLCFLRKAK